MTNPTLDDTTYFLREQYPAELQKIKSEENDQLKQLHDLLLAKKELTHKEEAALMRLLSEDSVILSYDARIEKLGALIKTNEAKLDQMRQKKKIEANTQIKETLNEQIRSLSDENKRDRESLTTLRQSKAEVEDKKSSTIDKSKSHLKHAIDLCNNPQKKQPFLSSLLKQAPFKSATNPQDNDSQDAASHQKTPPRHRNSQRNRLFLSQLLEQDNSSQIQDKTTTQVADLHQKTHPRPQPRRQPQRQTGRTLMKIFIWGIICYMLMPRLLTAMYETYVRSNIHDPQEDPQEDPQQRISDFLRQALALKHIDQLDAYGFTELHMASLVGNVADVLFLVENQADISKKSTEFGSSALDLASFVGQVTTVKLLLALGAPIDQQDNEGRSALISAIKEDHADVVTVLLAKGANLKQADNNGFSPLHYAILGKKTEFAQKLIIAGADVNQATKRNSSEPIFSDDSTMTSLAAFHGGTTPLHVAAENGDVKTAHALLNAKANIDAVNQGEFSPLFTALLNAHEDMAALLLLSKADPTGVDTQGNTAYHIACKGGGLSTIELLKRTQAKINQPNHQGMSPLHEEARLGHTQQVQGLLAAGADVNQPDVSNKASALMHAASQGHVHLMLTLIANDANIEQPDSKKNPPLLMAASQGQTNAVAILLAVGAKVSSSNIENLTALQLAAVNGYTNVVALLLEHGAQQNRLSGKKYQATALHAAAAGGHTRTVRLLLENGAQSRMNRYGEKPIDVAQDYPTIVALLAEQELRMQLQKTKAPPVPVLLKHNPKKPSKVGRTRRKPTL